MAHIEQDTHSPPWLKRLTDALLVMGALYSLFLVINPYMPWRNQEIPIVDLVQLQRATHVFFLLACGYLLTAWRPSKRTLGSWSFALLSLVPLYTYWVPNAPGFSPTLEAKQAVLGFWAVTVLPVLIPQLRRWGDLLAAVMCLLPWIYQLRFFEDLVNRAVIPTVDDTVMSYGLMMLVLGVVCRLLGPVMPILVLLFMTYVLYGNYVPGTFTANKSPIDAILGKAYNETEGGIYGIITGVSAKFLVYFTLLSGMISALGLGRIIANVALAMAGRTPATPGRVTGIASVFMGMFSGSGAADTQFVATLAKPLFEKAGYDRMIAAGLVATAGTIAIITPPVLGSIAFIMVEVLNISYATVVTMAIVPCILYLLAVLSFNEFYTRKAKLAAVGETFPRGYIWRYSIIFLPILLIIAMLYRGFEVSTAAPMAMIAFIFIAYVDPTLSPKGFWPVLEGLREGFKSLIPIGTAIAAANIIFLMLVTSGLTTKISQFLGEVAGSSLLLATIITALFSLILGMGVPPTATYVLTASLTAPAIVGIAQQNGIPQAAALLATHMFLFYYAVLADVTPPIALSAYASSSVFKTDPIRTGVYAARAALAKYLIGFFFLFSFAGTGLLLLPVLQDTTLGLSSLDKWGIILQRVVSVSVGIVLLSAATVGYTRINLERWESWVLGLLALCCFIPYSWLNLLAAAIAIGWFFVLKPRAIGGSSV